MTGIVLGQSLGVSNADHRNYEIVTVTAVTATTFSAVFTLPHTLAPVLLAYVDYVHSLTIAGVQYSFAQGSNPQASLPVIIASLAAADPNCAVTYPGTGQDVTITAVVQNTVVQVSGSGGNPTVNLANGSVTSLPNGTYQFYVTYQNLDGSLESNPSPVSNSVTVVNQPIDVTLVSAPPPPNDAPTDSRVAYVNIYVTGGTLGQAYRAGQLPSTVASPATVFQFNVSDLTVTDNGIVMPVDNDPPPAAAGLGGPQWSRLYAWSTVAHPNRLFYTEPNLPQYWPGSSDEQVGNWVDVGLDQENILWCSFHTNLTVIYKERSIWMLIGDPATGTLEPVYDGKGIVNAFALAPAGQIDYFIAPNGLCLFDMSQVHEISNQILPLFNQSIPNTGPLTPPGSILPGAPGSWNISSTYAVAIGHAMGRLYVSYAELGNAEPQYNLLVFDEGPEPERQAFVAPRTGRWFYHRNTIPNTLGMFGFFFDGTNMLGLTGSPSGGAAAGYSLADFRNFFTADLGGTAIQCVYQSHYEDCGLPDNDKQWLEVAVDFEFAGGASANVYAGFNNGTIAPALVGSLTAGARRTLSFGFSPGQLPAQDAGVLARNVSVLINANCAGRAVIHNIYLFYYVEARLAAVASTLPTDLGVGKVKECKEMELDIDASTAASGVGVALVSDLPGNALATRHSITVTQAGRALLKYPFPTAQGYLWQAAFVGAGGPFRLYSARLLMRVIGVYVEGYESAAGFVWDSMQIALGAGEVSTLDQLRFEMEASGASSVQLFTDLPGEASVSHGTFTLTAGPAGRAWVTVPLPEGIEARSVQVQVTGAANYRLYRAQVRHFRIGRFLMGMAPDGLPDAFNTLEFDLQAEHRNMFKRIEVDMRADGVVLMQVMTDQDGDKIAPIYAPALATPNGRTAVLVVLPPGVRGRLLRIRLSSAAPPGVGFTAQTTRVYGIRVWTRRVNDAQAAWGWMSFPLEASEVLPTWVDIMDQADGTAANWQWIDLPLNDLVTSG
jgi:hypothetical protein